MRWLLVLLLVQAVLAQPSPPPGVSAAKCPSCKQAMRPTGKTRNEGMVMLKEYTCGPHTFWVVTEGAPRPTAGPNSCPVCGMPNFMSRYQPGVGQVYKCQSGHETVK